MARVKVKRTNPSLEIEVDDELVLKLFTDVAGCKTAIRLLGGFMFAGFSIMSGLIVIL
jgi:hypothetical protein